MQWRQLVFVITVFSFFAIAKTDDYVCSLFELISRDSHKVYEFSTEQSQKWVAAHPLEQQALAAFIVKQAHVISQQEFSEGLDQSVRALLAKKIPSENIVLIHADDTKTPGRVRSGEWVVNLVKQAYPQLAKSEVIPLTAFASRSSPPGKHYVLVDDATYSGYMLGDAAHSILATLRERKADSSLSLLVPFATTRARNYISGRIQERFGLTLDWPTPRPIRTLNEVLEKEKLHDLSTAAAKSSQYDATTTLDYLYFKLPDFYSRVGNIRGGVHTAEGEVQFFSQKGEVPYRPVEGTPEK